MPAGWTEDETKALIDCWGEGNVQSLLDYLRNRSIYERIAAEMAKRGYNKSRKQCRVKVKNLTQSYGKVCLVLFGRLTISSLNSSVSR